MIAAAILAATLAVPFTHAAEESKPRIHSRAAWGALEEVAGKAIYYGRDVHPNRITLHHTDIAIPPDQLRLAREWLELSPDRRVAALAVSREQAAEHVRRVQRLHLDRGWNDIGYHFMIDWMGRIYEGRPVGALGAHTEEENRGNIGIALLGDMQHEDPSVPQRIAAERLVRWLSKKHGIRPTRIMAHRDYAATDCPGNHFYPWVERARKGSLARPAPTPERAVRELLQPWRPGSPGLARSPLAQRMFDGLLPH
ncbi:MAG: N-acetylmuramoyl-L-alanine amidase [Elusimicrobia bacterium]|nr:N-acetylmuramoyl-L-alanine amidase [Elusimicrobiota bacterium]